MAIIISWVCLILFPLHYPQQDELSYYPERVLPVIYEGLRAFIGQTAFFARIGFTDAAHAEAKAHDAWLVYLVTLDRDLRHYCATGKQMGDGLL
jgi:hypothetical protein